MGREGQGRGSVDHGLSLGPRLTRAPLQLGALGVNRKLSKEMKGCVWGGGAFVCVPTNARTPGTHTGSWPECPGCSTAARGQVPGALHGGPHTAVAALPWGPASRQLSADNELLAEASGQVGLGGRSRKCGGPEPGVRQGQGAAGGRGACEQRPPPSASRGDKVGAEERRRGPWPSQRGLSAADLSGVRPHRLFLPPPARRRRRDSQSPPSRARTP